MHCMPISADRVIEATMTNPTIKIATAADETAIIAVMPLALGQIPWAGGNFHISSISHLLSGPSAVGHSPISASTTWRGIPAPRYLRKAWPAATETKHWLISIPRIREILLCSNGMFSRYWGRFSPGPRPFDRDASQASVRQGASVPARSGTHTQAAI